MNKGEFVERKQEMHPGTSVARIMKALNEAIRDYSRRTKLLTGTYTQNTTQNKRYYELDADIIEIISIDVDDKEALKLVGRPTTRDIT